MAIKIVIANQLPIEDEYTKSTIRWWNRNGKIDTTLYDKYRIEKQKLYYGMDNTRPLT